MGTPELLALSLGLSLLLAALTCGLMRVLEARAPDPVLREKAWAFALYLPALPIVVVGVALLLPPPTAATSAGLEEASSPASVVFEIVQQGASLGAGDGETLAVGALVLAALLAVMRALRLGRRIVRLHRLIRATGRAMPEVVDVVRDTARRLGAPMPQVLVHSVGREPLVAGLRKPVLILPAALIEASDTRALRAVCAHELAHLKRGDHRALWVEELLLTILAFNPILGVIRDHRSAAREEACDAAALAQAGEESRRLYARSLLDALRASPKGDDAPALTFTSSRRILVMRRLKAILSPVPVPGRRQPLTLLGFGVVAAAVAGTSSYALAAQREAAVAPQPAPAILASRALPAPRAAIAATRATPSTAPRAIVTSAPKPEPAPRPAPAPAPAPAAAPQAQVITNPSWTRRPMPASYPAAALEQGSYSGSADLSCNVQSDGRVSGCTIVNETPVGAGYGAAALAAAAEARLSPRSIDGVAVGGTVRFTVRFTRETE